MAYLVMPLEFLAEVCDDRLLDRKVRLPFFFSIPRSMPTASAEDPYRSEGTQRGTDTMTTLGHFHRPTLQAIHMRHNYISCAGRGVPVLRGGHLEYQHAPYPHNGHGVGDADM